jgi:hypothetical protein
MKKFISLLIALVASIVLIPSPANAAGIDRGQPKMHRTYTPALAEIQVRAVNNTANRGTIATTSGLCGVTMTIRVDVGQNWAGKAYTVVPMHEILHAYGARHLGYSWGPSIMHPYLQDMAWKPTLGDRRRLGNFY